MSAESQARLGRSVMRKLANCTVAAQGSAATVPGVLTSLPVEPVLGDVRVQTQDVQVRLGRVDLLGLGVPVQENTLVTVNTSLPFAGNYRVAVDPVDVPNTDHFILSLRKTR